MNNWHKYEKMAYKLSNYYAKKGFDVEELVSCCKEGYCHAVPLWDSEKGALSTYSYIWMKKYVLKYIDEHIEETNKYNKYIPTEKVLNEVGDNIIPSTILSDLKSIGGDVYTISLAIIDPPNDLEIKGHTPSHLRKAIERYFTTKGWKQMRIKRAFQRIQEAM